jgi:hypothetical protein
MFYTQLSETRVPSVRQRASPTQCVCVLCFARIWATSGYHKWGWGIVSTQWLYCVLHAVEWQQGTISEAEGLSDSMFVLCFACLWVNSWHHKWGWEIVIQTNWNYVAWWTMQCVRLAWGLREAQGSTGKSTANFRGSGKDLRSSSTQCLYCVLHAVERHQGNRFVIGSS